MAWLSYCDRVLFQMTFYGGMGINSKSELAFVSTRYLLGIFAKKLNAKKINRDTSISDPNNASYVLVALLLKI